ncbi:MAG: hypothetical protein U0836_11670 [Pirellulales bacterium]
MFVVVTVACVILGLFAATHGKQARAVAAFANADGYVFLYFEAVDRNKKITERADEAVQVWGGWLPPRVRYAFLEFSNSDPFHALPDLDGLTSVSILSCPQFDDEDAKALSRCTSVERVQIADTAMTKQGLEYLATMPRLQSLIIRCPQGGDFASCLETMSHLHRLEVEGLSQEEFLRVATSLPLCYVGRPMRVHVSP